MIGWLATPARDVPVGDAWLTANEHRAQERFTFEKRRTDWRLGRWCAKKAIGAYLAGEGRVAGPDGIGVVARSADDGAPLVEGVADPAPVVSLSHRDGVAVCAVGSQRTRVGCDLERVEPRRPIFIEDWFTESERRSLRSVESNVADELVTLVWSAKESVLKAVGEGLRRDTRSVEVELPVEPIATTGLWTGCAARDLEGGDRYHCWVRRMGPHLLVIATNAEIASAASPVDLTAAAGGR